ncbi:MAG: hypothetical protein JTT11_07255 [Candidatus Brockarchaeota archaeon]|nr:hypothetical protein [Candidatus Brockarchaeota archaeon]
MEGIKRPAFVLALVLASLLALTALLIGTGPVRHRGPWRIFPRDVAHWFGWAGAVLLGASASYSALKRGFPGNVKSWLAVHCIPGILSLLVTGIHLANRVAYARPQHFLSFFTFVLMATIVVSGIVGRYVKTKFLRGYWRTLHIPLTAIFYLTLGIHVLEKVGIL